MTPSPTKKIKTEMDEPEAAAGHQPSVANAVYQLINEENPKTLEATLHALATDANRPKVETIVRLGGCLAVVNGIRKFGESPGVVREALNLLGALTVAFSTRPSWEDFKKTLIQLNAVTVIVAAMEKYDTCHLVQCRGILIFMHMLKANPADLQGSIDEISTVVTKAMVQMQDVGNLQGFACICIHHLSNLPEAKQGLVSNDARTLVAKAMDKFKDDKDLQRVARKAMSKLMED